jgi:NAD(P)-dependent dehydrogenase (short-subunit alcohol dehydrogenase family)
MFARMVQASKTRNVFITGTSTGIGRACAIRLAQKGLGVLAGVLGEKDSLSI